MIYVWLFFSGNSEYFVILVCDTGFVIDVPNKPVQSKGPNAVTLASVCVEVNCVLLHTSSKYEKFHLEQTAEGKLRKVAWTPGKPCQDENTLKFVRLLRKTQEQIHAAIKQRFKFFDLRHLSNSYLLPLSKNELKKYGMPEGYENTPKLHYLVTVCCSLLNAHHPGFLPLSMEAASEVKAANIILHRLFKVNPLMYEEYWPIDFNDGKPGQVWTQTTFKELNESNILNFPRLNKDEINPIALELIGGTHALIKADGVLTYMKQILIKDKNLSRAETAEELMRPPVEWKIQYVHIKTPSDFVPTLDQPTWVPDWWDPMFGTWHDLTLVRCKIPPSNKSLTSANYHYPVIAFGHTKSNRMMASSPYDVIYFSRCFRCPTINGLISMDRHQAALLKMLSFSDEYRSTAKTINILNTVAQPERQMTKILPDVPQSVEIPNFIARRTRNTRLRRNNDLNSIYDLRHQTPHQIQSIGNDGDHEINNCRTGKLTN